MNYLEKEDLEKEEVNIKSALALAKVLKWFWIVKAFFWVILILLLSVGLFGIVNGYSPWDLFWAIFPWLLIIMLIGIVHLAFKISTILKTNKISSQYFILQQGKWKLKIIIGIFIPVLSIIGAYELTKELRLSLKKFHAENGVLVPKFKVK